MRPGGCRSFSDPRCVSQRWALFDHAATVTLAPNERVEIGNGAIALKWVTAVDTPAAMTPPQAASAFLQTNPTPAGTKDGPPPKTVADTPCKCPAETLVSVDTLVH